MSRERPAGHATSLSVQGYDAAARRPTPPVCCFDFDGLLVDTTAQWTRAYVDVCLASGGDVDRIDVAALNGASVAVAARELSRQLDVGVDSARLLRALTRAFTSEPPVVLPGVETLLEALAGSTRLMVVTNGPGRLVEESLMVLGLHHHFDAIVSAELVRSPKPAPDIYLEACRRGKAPPSDVVAFEDSPTGARAAHRAGLRVVGVPAHEAVSLDAHLLVTRLDDPRVFTYLNLS